MAKAKKTITKEEVKETPVTTEEVVTTPVVEEAVAASEVKEEKAVKAPKAPKTPKEAKEKEVVEEEAEIKKNDKGFFYGYGRRKTATARARLYLPTETVMVGETKLNRGDIYVNKQPIDVYFNDPFTKAVYTEVYRTTNTLGRFITTIVASGSGMSGQSGAAVLAIARALCAVDPKFKATLRKKGFMTRDPRMKERKKPGLMGARKQKSSPKR